jgi:hypothetical protein
MNPDHLYPGTPRDNALDMYARTNAKMKISRALTDRYADPLMRAELGRSVRQALRWKRKGESRMAVSTIPRDPRLSWRRA